MAQLKALMGRSVSCERTCFLHIFTVKIIGRLVCVILACFKNMFSCKMALLIIRQFL